jgi:hypothetical protein
MRALSGFCIAFLFASGMFAQYRGSATPYITGGFGSAVFPGGTSATTPGIVRFPTIAGHPGGGGPRLNVPFSPGYWRGGARGGNGAFIYSYPYPVFVGGGYYDSSAAGYADPNAGPPVQQPMAAAPPQAPAAPIIINIGVPTAPPPQAGPPESSYQPPAQQPQEDTSASEPAHYLLAFKDHTIYSAVAYWVDGSTLHYFTSGNVHNQVSLSLVDRELTERLNKEIGMPVNLPK